MYSAIEWDHSALEADVADSAAPKACEAHGGSDEPRVGEVLAADLISVYRAAEREKSAAIPLVVASLRGLVALSTSAKRQVGCA